MPQVSGNGLAMRAGMMLEGLARRFEVHLFVAAVAGGVGDTSFARSIARRVGELDLAASLNPHAALIARVTDPEERERHRVAFPGPWLTRFCTARAARQLDAFAEHHAFVAAHVMRLYLAPLVERMEVRPPIRVLDLDDDEVRTRHGLAWVLRLAGDERAALFEEREAAKFATLAAATLPRFDRVLACSEGDAARLASDHPAARWAVVPNGLSAPNVVSRKVVSGLEMRLLFVGNLGYVPNADGLRFLCREIVPALRRLGQRPVVVDVVGGGASPDLMADVEAADVRLHGHVGSLAEWYARADIAVVPLRAGGGTRIKIIEAFAHGVPVVSTIRGAEGLDVVAGEHIVLTDEDPVAFARACLTLAEAPDQAAEMAGRAEVLFRRRYASVCVHERLAAVYDDVLM